MASDNVDSARSKCSKPPSESTTEEVLDKKKKVRRGNERVQVEEEERCRLAVKLRTVQTRQVDEECSELSLVSKNETESKVQYAKELKDGGSQEVEKSRGV